MVSFDTIRDQFRQALARKPLGLTAEEKDTIIGSLRNNVSTEDEHLFVRFDQWMRHPNHSDQIVCANVELVRFGVLAPRPPQKSKSSKENSVPSEGLSLVQPDKLDKFLHRIDIEPKSVYRRGDTVEARAKLVDKWVSDSIDSKERIDLLPLEEITPESNIGNNRPTSMKHISVQQLVKCIARSENASALKDYAMDLMAISKIYDEEAMIAKDNAIIAKDDKIDRLEQKIDRLLEFGEKAAMDRQDLKDELADVKVELGATKQTIDTIADHLVKKSRASTKDPEYAGFQHYALVTSTSSKFGKEYKFTSGQSDYVDKTKSELLGSGYVVHKDKFYNANGVDYRRNVEHEMLILIDKKMAPVNDSIIEKRKQLAREIEETNAMLHEDIAQWNAELAEKVRIHNLTATKQVKLSANGRRYYYGRNQTYKWVRRYENECRSYERECLRSEYKLKDTPVKVGATYIRWHPNEFISLKEIDAIMDKVVKETQSSPYQSEEDNTMPALLSDDEGY